MIWRKYWPLMLAIAAIELIIIGLAICLYAPHAAAGDLTVDPPTVNGEPADAYGVWISTRPADDPNHPWSAPEPLESPLEMAPDLDYRITIKTAAELTAPTHPADNLGPVERSIYELQRAAGIRP